MNIETEDRKGWTVFHLDGDLDSGSTAEIQAHFMKRLSDGASFLLDMEKVNYLDSSGLAALVKFYKEVRARGGSMALCSVQRDALKILQLTRLDKIFTILPNQESAKAA
jgi:anti-sigma B factor antagonist